MRWMPPNTSSAGIGRSCCRRPVFPSGIVSRACSTSTSAHRIASTSPMRSPVTAANRIAATDAGCRSASESSATESACNSDGARVRSRGVSRARSMPRAGFVFCSRHPPRLEQTEQPRRERQQAVVLRPRQPVDHPLNVASRHAWDLQRPKNGDDVATGVLSVFPHRTGRETSDALPCRCPIVEEPGQPVTDRGRFALLAATLQGIDLTSPDRDHLPGGPLASIPQGQLGTAPNGQPPLAPVDAVVQDVALDAAGGHPSPRTLAPAHPTAGGVAPLASRRGRFSRSASAVFRSSQVCRESVCPSNNS